MLLGVMPWEPFLSQWVFGHCTLHLSTVILGWKSTYWTLLIKGKVNYCRITEKTRKQKHIYSSGSRYSYSQCVPKIISLKWQGSLGKRNDIFLIHQVLNLCYSKLIINSGKNQHCASRNFVWCKYERSKGKSALTKPLVLLLPWF